MDTDPMQAWATFFSDNVVTGFSEPWWTSALSGLIRAM